MLKFYLVAYNFLSGIAWGYALVLMLQEYISSGSVFPAYNKSGDLIRWVQTAALLEILHSLLGFVKSPVSTTAAQVSSRLLLVWGVLYPFDSPEVRGSPAFISMVVAWGITEVVRYSYYGINLLGNVPAVLLWCRYNFFWVLYPLGASSEAFLLWKSIPFTSSVNQFLPYIFWGILLGYPLGLYVLYSHMIKQRRSYMKKGGSAPTASVKKVKKTQ